MSQNRLNLDFSIEYADDRNQFVTEYIESPQFKQYPLTPDELETIANYILWGKDRKTGLNPRQDKSLVLPSKSGDWANNEKCESLDALMESPTFNETQIAPVTQAPTKIKREVFSREEALETCPDSIKQTFVDLFGEIDKLEILVSMWELAHGKRKKQIRQSLVSKFGEEEIEQFKEKISHWNQFMYLKQRHNLVDLRRQQYSLRDSYTSVATRHTPIPLVIEEELDWDVDIEVLPLGIQTDKGVSKLVFRELERLNPEEYNEKELKQISDLYWKKTQFAPTANSTWIDFREPEHVYQMFRVFYELEEQAEENEWKTNTQALMRALKFYIDMADLTELQREILDLKLKKEKNTDIARIINKKYNKSYTQNYISTIFKQRIIEKITEAAKYHEKIVSNLFFPEEFKVCSCCGVRLLRDAENFTHRSRSKDGFSPRCKKCEKAARQGGTKK